MTVHIITGPPCAGKTTFAKSQTGEVIDLDDIEEELGGERYAEHSPVRARAIEIRKQRIDAALAADADVWVIHTAPTAQQMAEYLAAGAVVRRIDPGIDVALERAASRPPHTVDVIRAWYAEHTPSSAPPGGTHAASAAVYDAPTGTSGTTETKGADMSGQQNTNGDGKNGDSQFTPITSQADLDRLIGDRLAREREKFAGFEDYKAKAEKFDAAEDSRKTEDQKTAERIAALEQKNAELEAERLRQSVAAAKGVPAELLTGTTKEELDAQADKLRDFSEKKELQAPGIDKTSKEPTAGVTKTFVKQLFGGND